ncbi:MAG TPA: carboxypeptidase-like regulatory domain-containing protein, partial [Gemmatimonadaceae bacterium]
MKRILFAVLALLLNLAAVSLQAQNPGARPPAGQPPAAAPGEVRGSIVAADSSAAAVPRPAIAVRNKSDGKLVTGAYGAEDGTFRVQGLRPGTYYLRVSGIGFTPLNTP